jgi:type IX secretion system PorP/SprF family membrane protein
MKNYSTLILYACMLLLLIKNIHAQDIHFSQYNASPLVLNPALAGLNNADYRVYANFRSQWASVAKENAYRTFAGGADMSAGKISKRNSFAGFGVSFFSEQAGSIKYTSNRIDLSFAYHFMLNKRGNMQLSAGLQGAFNIRSIDPSRATFDTQYDYITGTLDATGIRENIDRNKVIFGDVGAGIIYSVLTRNGSNYYTGVSVTHLNQPNISFYATGGSNNTNVAEKLRMRTAIHGGACIPISKRAFVMPNYMVLVQGPSYEFNIGTTFKTIVGNPVLSKTAVYFGAQYRGLFDAVILNARIDYKGLSCGMSYDINISKLVPASKTIGAPEISFTYQGAFRKKPQVGHCPSMF